MNQIAWEKYFQRARNKKNKIMKLNHKLNWTKEIYFIRISCLVSYNLIKNILNITIFLN